MSNVIALHPVISDADLHAVCQHFAEEVAAGRLEVGRTAPDVLYAFTPDGSRGFGFGLARGRYHAVDEVGRVVAEGSLGEVLRAVRL